VARYHVLRWKEIPSLVEARDGDHTARVPLSQRFQDLIDAVAMREGASDTEAYLAGWGRDPEVERPGEARSVAEAVAAELEASFAEYVERCLGSR
jgi:hypothetical protein